MWATFTDATRAYRRIRIVKSAEELEWQRRGAHFCDLAAETLERGLQHRPSPPFTFAENMTVVTQPNHVTRDERPGVQAGKLVRVTANGIESLRQFPLRALRVG